jgi:hypothetical protein
MTQPSMRAPSPLERIRRLETDLNASEQATRLQAARRIHEIGMANAAGSQIRNQAIGLFSSRLAAEPGGRVRQQLESMLGELRGEESERRIEPGAVPSRTPPAVLPVRGESLREETESGGRPHGEREESAAGRLLRRAGGAAVSRALGPIGIVAASLSGCAVTFEDSVMYGETGLVREFTEDLTRNDTTVEQRVRTIVGWGQRNLPHFHGDYMLSVYGDNADSVENVSIRDVFRERVVGCHHAVFALVTMLRSIGIQADYIRSESIGAGADGHGIMYIPEIDRYVHGDDICMMNLVPTELTIRTRENLIAYYNEYLSVDPNNPPASLGPASDAFWSQVHSGGFLRRDGNSLFIEGGVVHAGYEETEFPRLQAMFPEFEITPGPARSDGLGTTFTTRRVPIIPLE